MSLHKITLGVIRRISLHEDHGLVRILWGLGENHLVVVVCRVFRPLPCRGTAGDLVEVGVSVVDE